MATRLADQLADNLLAVAVAVHQLAECGRLFDRVQIFALNILDESHLERVCGAANERRNLRQPSRLGRPPAPFAGDDDAALGARLLSGDDRLEDALVPDGGGQVSERGRIEVLTGLAGVGLEEIDRHEDDTAGLFVVEDGSQRGGLLRVAVEGFLDLGIPDRLQHSQGQNPGGGWLVFIAQQLEQSRSIAWSAAYQLWLGPLAIAAIVGFSIVSPAP